MDQGSYFYSTWLILLYLYWVMRYTWPKFKLCRREGVNLFWPAKYDVRKRRWVPGQHGAGNVRYSEYGKLLRNKQVLKRIYQLTEKTFKRIVMKQAATFAKNKGVDHDKAVFQFLERRLDTIVLRAGLANTIMQARQIVNHGHLTLNWRKHNIPSYTVQIGDVIEVRKKLQPSALYQSCPLIAGNHTLPSRCKVNKKSFSIEVVDLPKHEEISVPVDILKVIEFYARA